MSAERDRLQHLVGRRVRLEHCTDAYSTLPVGTLGTVDFIDDAGTVHVEWDNGARLGMVDDAGDRYTVLPDLPEGLTVEAFAEVIKREILADEAAHRVPLCPDFGTLHSFVDANDYLIVADEELLAGGYNPASQAQANFHNAALDAVSAWLHDRFQAHHKERLAAARDHAVLKAEFTQAFDALRAAGLEHDADHPIAAAYRAASDAVNHSNRSREAKAIRALEDPA
jgi:hypothetical protein